MPPDVHDAVVRFGSVAGIGDSFRRVYRRDDVLFYIWHQSLGVTLGPIRALAAGAVLLMLWVSTITIVAFSDRAFVSAFRTT